MPPILYSFPSKSLHNSRRTLRKNVQNDLTLVFEFMPEVFTIGEVEAAYKAVYGLEDRVPNFRRKIEKYVIETDAAIKKTYIGSPLA